ICLESGFPLISVFDAYIIISPSDIKFGEVFSPFQLIDEFRNKRKRICVLDSSFIEYSIILTGSQFSIFLVDKEKWRCHGRFRGSDVSFLEIVVNKVLEFSLFR